MARHEKLEAMHTSNAVAWLERDYDDWKYMHYTVDDVTYTRLLERSLHRQSGSGRFANGPSHDQSMIRIKEDGPRGNHWTDRQVWEIFQCFNCPPNGGGHHCDDCRRKITHMAGNYCLSCWEQLSSYELMAHA